MAAILDLYVNSYLYRHNNWTNGFLDIKLVEKEVLVEIFGQIVQNIIFLICRLAAILNNARSRAIPRWSDVFLVIFIGDWSLYIRPLRNLGYI